MFKKGFLFYLTFCLIMTLFIDSPQASANIDQSSNLQEITNEIIGEKLGQELLEKVNVVGEYNEGEVKVDLTVENESSTVNTSVVASDENNVSVDVSYLDDNNEQVDKSYFVNVHQYDEDKLIATLVDSETGETMDLNTTELHASVIPVVIAAIISVGVRAALRWLSKEAIKAAVRKLAFKSTDLLKEHYKKHGKEFGNISQSEYLELAQDLIGSDSDDVLSKKRSDGDRVFYNKSTNEFAVLGSDGYLKTFFKPKDGKKYYDRQ
ncbi:SAR2788 family putative toxin [Lysinibacillus sp. FSL M8-0216]|uniref:SAR2788 family putative toxin n=1 Tax=Lysinibacillus sp. FSL M8-0216 TaxID=2921619 RepID=UPI00315A0F35